MERDGVGHLSDADLVAYDDGTMTAERQARADAHLARCSACQRRIEEFREVGRLIRETYPLVDDPEARARIVAQSRAELEARRSGRAGAARSGLAGRMRRLLAKIRPRRPDR